MTLPICHYLIVTFVSLPNCNYQIVTLPNCHYQIVITKLSLPNFHYQIVITKLTLQCINTSLTHQTGWYRIKTSLTRTLDRLVLWRLVWHTRQAGTVKTSLTSFYWLGLCNFWIKVMRGVIIENMKDFKMQFSWI